MASAADRLVRVLDVEASDLSADVRRVADRLRTGRFEVLVVGEFNRGKSTLINALVGQSVLPAGPLPVTSIRTELIDGHDAARVHFRDGGEQVIDLNELEHYVSEEINPGNRRAVESVSVHLPATMLRHGATFVDTPGVNSIFRSSAEEARKMVLGADAALVVLSADAPMTDAERTLLKLLSKRSARTFFVLNRIDHLDAAELERVQWFVDTILTEIFGADQPVFAVSARTGQGIDDLRQALDRFLTAELDDARGSLARRDLENMAARIDDACALEASALSLDAEALEDRLSRFDRAASWQREGLNEDSVLFEHAIGRIESDTDLALGALRLQPDEAALERLRHLAEDTKPAELEATLDKAIEEEIRLHLEPVRRRTEQMAEEAWRRAAERFDRATQRRAAKLREVAGDLFDVALHAPSGPPPAEVSGRFFYSPPVRVTLPTNMLGRLVRPLMTERRSRTRLLHAAEARMRAEYERHTTRLHDDLQHRLRAATEDLQHEMEKRVSDVAAAMHVAMERGRAAQDAGHARQAEQRGKAQRLQQAARSLREAVTTVG